MQHIFLHISWPLFCTTSTYVKLPSCTFYGEKNRICSDVPFFFSLPLILTLLAANIWLSFSHRSFEFFMFFFLPHWTSSPFFFLFVLPFALALIVCVSGVGVVVVGGNSRTHYHVITKFSRIYRLPFFLSHARELRQYSFSITKSGQLLIAPYFPILVPLLPLKMQMGSEFTVSPRKKMSNNRQCTNSPR